MLPSSKIVYRFSHIQKYLFEGSVFLTICESGATIKEVQKTGSLCKQAESKLYCFDP